MNREEDDVMCLFGCYFSLVAALSFGVEWGIEGLALLDNAASIFLVLN